MRYYDPVRANPSAIDVPFCKPFGYSYQNEVRAIWLLPDFPLRLERVKIEIGAIDDCADLVSL